MTNRAQNKGPDRRRTGAGDPCAAAAGKNRQPRDGPAAGSRGMGPATRAAGPDDRPDLPTESRAGGGLPSAPARGAGPDDQPDARSRAGGGRRAAARCWGGRPGATTATERGAVAEPAYAGPVGERGGGDGGRHPRRNRVGPAGPAVAAGTPREVTRRGPYKDQRSRASPPGLAHGAPGGG